MKNRVSARVEIGRTLGEIGQEIGKGSLPAFRHRKHAMGAIAGAERKIEEDRKCRVNNQCDENCHA